MRNAALQSGAALLGRLLLALIFILSGWGKITGYQSTAGYMESVGAPGLLLPLVIIVELAGGILIAVGWQTRLAAIVLSGFTLLTALIFHTAFADQNQMIHFMKNLAIAGGFLVLFAHGPGQWSIDGRRMSGR
ncbi:MAG: DoxX family protein [Rhodospirillales bacterium]|nr:DoxX family protein [Rhodospirillales bacterium]